LNSLVARNRPPSGADRAVCFIAPRPDPKRRRQTETVALYIYRYISSNRLQGLRDAIRAGLGSGRSSDHLGAKRFGRAGDLSTVGGDQKTID
jgi:hypothetical protein